METDVDIIWVIFLIDDICVSISIWNHYKNYTFQCYIVAFADRKAYGMWACLPCLVKV